MRGKIAAFYFLNHKLEVIIMSMNINCILLNSLCGKKNCNCNSNGKK